LAVMARFGDYLREAREAKSVTLEQISTTTHISVRVLEALENERFDIVPGGVFTISFVRQYAHVVGLDEEEAVSRLKQVTRPLESALGEWNTKGADSDDTGAKLAEFFTDFVRRHRMTLLGGGATAVLLAGGFLFFQANEGREAESASRPPRIESRDASYETTAPDASFETAAPNAPVREAHPVEVAQEEAGNNQVATNASAVGGPSKAIQLELRLTDRAWVRVVADGERVLEDNLEAGYVQTIQAQESVQLFVGNAGGVKVALNGETMQPLGPPGHVRRVDVNPKGMEVVDIDPKQQSESGPPQSQRSQTEI
jgi:cytoskeletal protein RodZ